VGYDPINNPELIYKWTVSSQKVRVLGVFGGLRLPKTPNLPHLIEMIQ
jgi:hypothetical protein